MVSFLIISSITANNKSFKAFNLDRLTFSGKAIISSNSSINFTLGISFEGIKNLILFVGIKETIPTHL